MKVLITGTHFTPAQAVISELLKNPDNSVTYVGRRYTREGDSSPSVESQVLPKMGVKFISITAGRLQRSFTRYTIPSLLKIPIGFVQSFLVVLKEKPDVVASFGGYLGVPVVFSAWLLSIPVVLHEQTLISSLANKISSWFADRVAISFPENHDFPESKTVLTGNPIRVELIDEPKNVDNKIKEFVRSKKLPLILVTGGNQGAHAINQVVKEDLDKLTKKYLVIHQTGDSKYKDFETLEQIKAGLEHPERYKVLKWIDVEDLSLILRHVDLAISRAGINTLQELALFKVPVIVIPIENHYEQQKNARYFSERGLSQTLPQSKLEGNSLFDLITQMLKKKKVSSPNEIIKDAAKRVALEIELAAR